MSKGAIGEMRGRSASVSAIRNEENTAGYKAMELNFGRKIEQVFQGWLRQKLAEEKAKKEREAEKKEQEEKVGKNMHKVI